MTKSILRLQNVSKYYYSDTSVTQALRRINLEFKLGEFVAITGESGGGKSTLLNMISGLDTFDEGEMYFKGEPTFQFDEQDWEEYRRNQIGFVFQDYSLIGHYTALDNVVAALVIQEQESQKAEQQALSYLEQVGLKELAGQRASQLSSGQKQRLAIARALAKNTDIIVADEPTGNLDSETGIQVVQLLEKLSKEKLVIMVTHNYEQAEPYVTRKIRLHDGEVVNDITVNRTVAAKQEDDGIDVRDAEKNSESEKDTSEAVKKSGSNKIAGFFALKNIQMQKGRAALFFCIFLITAIVSFLFIGELLTYADDRITKKYDSTVYLQENDRRLSVRYPDNRDLTEEDSEKIRSLKSVEEVDLYDYANDVRYYYREGKDYKHFYGEREKTQNEMGEEVYKEVKGIQFLRSDQFMRSASCLTAGDLAEGRLPESRNEIVIYTKDRRVLGQERECYFTADNIWEEGEIFHKKLKVVGLLKKKTDQVYFDYRLCQMLTACQDGFSFDLDHCWDKKYRKFLGNMSFYPVIGDDLEENQVRVSKNYEIPSTSFGTLPESLDAAFPGKGKLHVQSVDEEGKETDVDTLSSDGTPKMLEEGMKEERGFILEDEDGVDVEIQSDFSDQGADFVELSEELFYQLYDKNSSQASVYITSYGKTDTVIKELRELGYDAVSTYRVSMGGYIEEKVFQRLEVICISSLILIALVVLQILLIRSILKIKIKNYDVLKFMGMRMRQLGRITYLEMGVHCIASIVAAGLVMVVLFLMKIPFIVQMMQYYSLLGVLLFLAYNILLMVLTVFFFNRLLKKVYKN